MPTFERAKSYRVGYRRARTGRETPGNVLAPARRGRGPAYVPGHSRRMSGSEKIHSGKTS